MTVTPHDRGGFLVTSEAGDGSYLVRLDGADLPLGGCSCWDFRRRVKGVLDRGTMPHKLQCKHIDATWRLLYARQHHAPMTFETHSYKGRQPCEARDCPHRSTATLTRYQMTPDGFLIVLKRYCAAHLATMQRDLRRDGYREAAT